MSRMAFVMSDDCDTNFVIQCSEQKMVGKLFKIRSAKSLFGKMKAARIVCRGGNTFKQFVPEFIRDPARNVVVIFENAIHVPLYGRMIGYHHRSRSFWTRWTNSS